MPRLSATELTASAEHALRCDLRAMSLVLGGSLLGLALPSSVHAQLHAGETAVTANHEVPPRDRSPEEPLDWYGWQTLTMDGASFALIAAQAAIDSEGPGLALTGAAGYLLGAPLVLLAHENPWALLSFGMRLSSMGLVFGGALVAMGGGCFTIWGEQPAGCDEREAIGGGLMIAGLVAVPAAIVLDAIMAREKRKPTHSTPAFGLWSDARHGSVGVSVAIAR